MKKILCIVPLVLVFCFTIACQDKAAMAELEKYKAQAKLEASNIEVIKTVIAEVDKGNLGVFQTYLAPEFKCYVPSNSTTPISRDDEIAMAKKMTTAIPDMKHNVTEIFAVGDRVVIRVALQGTHLAEFDGILPTGKKVSVSYIAIFRMKDGQVVEEIAEEDFLGFYQQLGMELKPIAAKKK